MIIACKQFGNSHYQDSLGNELVLSAYPDQGDRLLRWLVFSHTTIAPKCVKVVWDLSRFVGSVLSLLPDTVRSELSRPPRRAKHGSYRLFYITDKVFSVDLNGSSVSVYDLSQYFPGEPEPESIAGLQRKANQLQQALSGLGMPSVSTLSSPVALFKGHKTVSEIYDTCPTIFDALESHLDAYEIALQCTPREWISNYRVGVFPELWGYDLSSAYPYHASQLLDLRDCMFTRSDRLIGGAYYGFLIGDFTVYPDHPLAYCSPFLADRGDGVLVNFVGTVRDYPCLLEEVRTLYRYSMGEFHLKYGWFVSPINGVRPRLSFKKVMDELYSMRNGDELKSYIVKRVMNGIIGKLLEVRKDEDGNIVEYGDLYNPIYHAIVTTRTRLQVFEFIVRHNITREELVHIGVDGVNAIRYIPLPKQAPMGRWRCSGSEPTAVLSPGGVLTMHRNFKRTGYAELAAECLARPTACRLGRDGKDPIDLRRLWMNQNRHFPELPRIARDLLESTYLSDPVELG